MDVVMHKILLMWLADDNSAHSLGLTTGHEFATSVAAAAYAIHSLDIENTNDRNGKTLAKERSLKRDDQLVPLHGSGIIGNEIEASNTGNSREWNYRESNTHKDGKQFIKLYLQKIVIFFSGKRRTKESPNVKVFEVIAGKGSAKKPSSEAPLTRKPINISSSSSKISTNDKIDAWERNKVQKLKERSLK